MKHSEKAVFPNTPAQSVHLNRCQRSVQRRLSRAFLIYAIVPYLSVITIFAVIQRQLMYRPIIADSLAMTDLKLSPDFGFDLQLSTSDGNTIRGWLISGSSIRNDNQQAPDQNPLVIYFPGNSQNRHQRISDLREIATSGFDVLIFDYRGFGDSEGSPSEMALSTDAQMVWQHAIEALGYSEDRIVVFGESIGGAVAVSLWAEVKQKVKKPAALILSSTFASMPKAVQWNYPLFPFHWLLLDKWPSIDRIAKVPSPVVIFHGSHDQMVPVSHGRLLAKVAVNAKLIEIPGGVHNEIPSVQLRRELDLIATQIRAAQAVGVE